MKQLLENVLNPFDVNKISSLNNPIKVHGTQFDIILPKFRANYLLVKDRGSMKLHVKELPANLQDIVYGIINFAAYYGLPIKERYIYLSFDHAEIYYQYNYNKAFGEPAWHVDGFQGPEVLNKANGDFFFTVASGYKQHFYQKKIDLSEFNPLKDSLFSEIQKQVTLPYANSTDTDTNKIYLYDYTSIYRNGTPFTKGWNFMLNIQFTEIPKTPDDSPCMCYDFLIYKVPPVEPVASIASTVARELL